MKWINKDFLKEIYQIWITEKPTQLAAALAYFGIFSFAAVIFIAYQVAGIFINEVAAAERLYTRLEPVLGPETVAFIQEMVTSISTADTGGSLIVTAISFFSLLYVAMSLFLQLKYALNRIWGVPLIQIGKKFSFLRSQLFAFIMLLILGLVVILATMINVFFAWFGSIINDLIGGSTLLSIFNVLALLGVITMTNAFTYKILPDVKITWRDVWLGAVTATLLTALGGLVIGFYFSLGGVNSAFEAAGAFAILMIMIYYFAQIFLFGAVITRVYTQRYGSMADAL